MTLKQLRERRAQIVAQMRALHDQHQGADWNDSVQANYDNLDNELIRIDASIKREQDILAREGDEQAAAALADAAARAAGPRNQGASGDQRMSTFLAYLRGGMQALDDDGRRLMHAAFRPQDAQSVGTGSSGGYTVPQEFSGQIESALRAFGGMRSIADVIPTGSGADLPWPTDNDTTNEGEIVGENTTVSQLDVTYGSVTFKSFKFSSKLILVSLELLQDSAFDLGPYFADKLATRIGRIQNRMFTVGTNSGQPQGAAVAAPVGKVGATGKTVTFDYDDLIDLMHSVDPAYRQNARWMLNDTTLKVARKLKDSTGAPIYLPGFETQGIAASPGEDYLLGKPLVVNNHMPVPAANAKSILFGDFKKYKIRDVTNSGMLIRFGEKYLDQGSIGFLYFTRADGRLVDAGTNPIQAFQHSAT